MLKIDVKKASEELKTAFRDVTPAAMQKAVGRAINHTLDKAKTQANKLIRDRYKMPANEVRSRIFVMKASTSSMTGKIMAVKAPLPLAAFNPVQITGDVMTRKVGSFRNAAGKKVPVYGSKKVRQGSIGVKVEIVKGQTKTIKSAFIAVSKTGGSGVKARGSYGPTGFGFASDGGSNKQTSLNTKSVFWAMKSDQVMSKLNIDIMDNYRGRLQHELLQALKYAREKANA